MKLFSTTDEVAALEANIQQAEHAAALPASVELAWHLRERDPDRAWAMLHSLRAAQPAPASDSAPTLEARLDLLEAELHIVAGDIAHADACAQRAATRFRAAGDGIGLADSAWVQCVIATEQGLIEESSSLLEAASNQAKVAGDALRADLFDAARALHAAYSGAFAAVEPFEALVQAALLHDDVALRGWAFEVRAAQAWQLSKFDICIDYFSAAVDAYRQTGQLRRTMVAACNLAGALCNVNDHDTALTHLGVALELARRTGSPRNVGMCLAQTARSLGRLGQLDAAESYMLDAQRVLAPLPPSHSHAMLLGVLGEVRLVLNRPAEALLDYKAQGEFAMQRSHLTYQISALRGQAEALAALQRHEEALAAAESALSLAGMLGHRSEESLAFEVIAAIHDARPVSTDLTPQQPTLALHFLHKALAAAQAVSDKHPRVRLLHLLAAHHAAAGEYAEAYRFSEWAGRARDIEQSEAASRHARVLEVRHKLAQAQAEAEHHAGLALEQARRAEVLADHSQTLVHLGDIGQEITAQLNAENVCATLNRHVHNLLDVDCLCIFQLSADGARLEPTFAVDGCPALLQESVALDSADSWLAECARTGAIILQSLPDADDASADRQPLMSPMRSALFAPMTIGEQLLGVISLHSQRTDVYGEREKTILGSLCAYGAVALENARVHGQLQQALDELHQAKAAQRTPPT